MACYLIVPEPIETYNGRGSVFLIFLYGNCCGILSKSCVSLIRWRGFLAATKQLYEWYFPSVRLSVCLSVRLSVRHTCLPEASFGLRVLSLPASVCLCVRVSVRVCINHGLVRTITHHSFKLESPNLDQRCKRPWFRYLLFLGMIDLDLKGQI